MNDRPFSLWALFAVVYTTSVSSVYFALGVVAHRANGLTPLVFLGAGIYFLLGAMTYAEGASLHPERGGSAVFARYAFNELISFIAGWAIVLDYTILIAVTALTVPAYLDVFWSSLGHGAPQIVIALAVILFVALDNITGVNARRLRRRIWIAGTDLALQAAVIVLGLVLAFHPHRVTETIHLGTAPTWTDLAFALPIAVIALRFTDPDRERPYRMPWNVRVRGHQLPLTAVIGVIGTFAAWCSVLALHVDARYVGTGWMIVGVAGYVVFRRRQGIDLTSHYKIPHRERPAYFVELDYRSALVPIFGTDVDASALRAAARLVGEGAIVEAVYVLRVPNQLSLDAGLEEEERLGLSVLESAKVTGRRIGLKVQTRLIRTRNPGAAIGEEAKRSNAEIIYLGTAHAPPSERALGPTASYLLAHRPCRVVIESPPAGDGRLEPRGYSANR